MLSTALPFFLLRPLSPSHDPSHASKSVVRNRMIVTDPYTAFSTSLLASSIFAVLLEASFFSYLPIYMITHFSHLRSLEAAHLGAAGLPTLLLALLPAGLACTLFLFAPPTGTPLAAQTFDFDPTTSSLGAHVYWSTWGWYSPRQKELAGRAALLAGLIVAETVVQVWGTIEGAELLGALGYAGIWAVGVGLIGAVLDWVGGPSD